MRRARSLVALAACRRQLGEDRARRSQPRRRLPGIERRIAIADLGSNTFRLVVFTTGEGWWRRTDEIYEAVRIGEGLAATGELGAEPLRRGLAAVDVFAHFCRATGIDEVEAVATSAIRDAANRDEFIAHAALPARVLSAEQEAHYGYLAAVNSTTLGDGCVLDLGGGSLQITRVVGRLAREERSWKLGAVRMSERFGDDRKALRKHVRSEIGSVAGGRLVAIGGTARNLAAADQGLRSIPSFGVQGHVIARDALADLVDELAGRSPAERGKLRGIKPERGDIILAGAQTILTVLDIGGFDAVEVTEAGLREGVFFSKWLAPEELFDDVRRQSVLNLAGLYHVDHAHTEHVARLALGLFDELAAAGLHAGDAGERELLWAAAVLHDIGMTVDYDDHHKHSRYLILNGGLPGFTPREVALIGQAVRYHRKGSPGLGPFGPLMVKGDEAVLLRLSALLRLAEDLERPRDQLVREVHADVSDGRVELQLVTEGDASVPRWAAARETDLFAAAFGRRLVV